MLPRLEEITRRFREIEGLLSTPEVAANPVRLKALAREHGSLRGTVAIYEEFLRVEREIVEGEAIVDSGSDPELAALAAEELPVLREKRKALMDKIYDRFLSIDDDSDRNVIVEIRAGTGGDEASLFAVDLFGMYKRYADRVGWTVEVMDSSQTAVGGFKDITFSISGENVFQRIRFESGGHRVQRVPATETQGRIHTSAATVAVMPEADEVDIVINDGDLQVDTMRAGGPGGQNVNKVSSAVRLTHLPSGLVVKCQDDRSQHKNRAKALNILRARLYELENSKRMKERTEMRRTLIGSGDRSERIRTYNFPQNRVTDHRINLTIYNLDRVIMGELDDLIGGLMEFDRAERLKNLNLEAAK